MKKEKKQKRELKLASFKLISLQKDHGHQFLGIMDCALTCFQQDNLVVLAQVHEAGDAFGKFHHILNGIGDVVRALLPHPLSRLERAAKKLASYHDVNATFSLDSSWRL